MQPARSLERVFLTLALRSFQRNHQMANQSTTNISAVAT
jgi:hypothetical protein